MTFRRLYPLCDTSLFHVLRHKPHPSITSNTFFYKFYTSEFDSAKLDTEYRFNQINIQMLSSSIYRHVFGELNESRQMIDNKTLDKVISHLKAHDIWGRETSILPNIEFPLPKLKGSDISEHFQNIGDELSKDYKALLFELINHELPLVPNSWKFVSGWSRYEADGSSTSVSYPEDGALIFDVEVCMQEGNYPTLAAAVSKNYWYLWCSERLVENHFSWSDGIGLDDLIPLETELYQTKPKSYQNPKLIIGHNVGFDRTFVREQYLLENTGTYFLDTMSLHICVSGLTGLQRAMSIASKKDTFSSENMEFPETIPMGWAHVSSLNNLADVYKLYCNGPLLDKSKREVFVSGSILEIKEKFQELASYCAQDVMTTYLVLKKITPMFFERFPHSVTFAGLLEMSSVYLPVNQNWNRYLHETQDTYEDLQKELKLSLIHLANDACSLLHSNMYKNDPWLWDLDWSVQEIKFRKMSTRTSKKKKQTEPTINNGNLVDNLPEIEEYEDTDILESNKVSCTTTDQTMEHIYETAAALRKIRPFLPGYPCWYRELCGKYNSTQSDWEPGPILISSQMRCAPKLMRLTWDGFPLHYDSKHGWGYLIPDASKKCFSTESNFPLRHLLELYSEMEHCYNEEPSHNIDSDWSLIKEPQENSIETSKLWKAILGVNFESKKVKLNQLPEISECEPDHYGIGPYDVGIDGCWFYRLPHKDGPHKRVGNPLSKDFLSKIEDGVLKSWGKGQADRALLLSKMLSYWKNAHSRIMSQMVVWLNQNELPDFVSRQNDFENNYYGAILPRLIPAGTVTRRAVEPTWLTASNAYLDRVGSELKSMIQAPVGYHFVGADVDSQELWIAAVLGDSQFAKLHGCTAFGWMTLQGKKSAGTDMHSRTAKSVGIVRNQAKVLNYARIYGAGKAFAQRLLMQFNHRLSPAEAKVKVKKIYTETKGAKKSVSLKGMTDIDTYANMKSKKIWVGGSESYLFNKLEEIANSAAPRTPVLRCRISRALEPKVVDTNFMTSRINWVVQSSAVDYLHLMLVSMKWLFKHYKINGRLSICIHDEIRYLVTSEDRYRAALALQITNLFTRSFFAFQLDMYDLPQSVAFFSSVDIDVALRKEVDMDSVTPSNPHGLEKGYGIPTGEALDIYEIIKKTSGGCLLKN